jgi:hypothetical protein
MIARGRFDVKVTPIPMADGDRFARYLLDKQIFGDLEAESAGEMMGAGTDVKGSAGAVAFEKVTGTLHGKRGTFVLQHKSTMRANADYRMDITVVPDSGTDELTGIAGTFQILLDGKDHTYQFDYTLDGT